jgi:hypothetical protein
MPKNRDDWYERVLDVSVDKLIGDPNLIARMREHQDNQLAKLEAQRHGNLFDQEAGKQEGPEAAPAEVAAEDGGPAGDRGE